MNDSLTNVRDGNLTVVKLLTSLQELQISAAEEELFNVIHQCEEESKKNALGDLLAAGVTELKPVSHSWRKRRRPLPMMMEMMKVTEK